VPAMPNSTYSYTAHSGDDVDSAKDLIKLPVSVVLTVASALFFVFALFLMIIIYALGYRMSKATFYRMMWYLPAFLCYATGMGYLFLAYSGLFSLRAEDLGSDQENKFTIIMMPLFYVTAVLRVATIIVGNMLAKLHMHRTIVLTLMAIVCSTFAAWSALVPDPARYGIYALSVAPLILAPVNWLCFHDRPWGGVKVRPRVPGQLSLSAVPCLVVIIYSFVLLLLIWPPVVALELAGHAFAGNLGPTDEISGFIVLHIAMIVLVLVAAFFAEAPGSAPPVRTSTGDLQSASPDAELAIRDE
jgi:hypothetical protein